MLSEIKERSTQLTFEERNQKELATSNGSSFQIKGDLQRSIHNSFTGLTTKWSKSMGPSTKGSTKTYIHVKEDAI